MKMNSAKQLKDWISNMVKKDNLVANTVLQNFMMERLLERIAISSYQDNFILKGGFLIASMIGLDMRSTLDMDTTIKGISVNREILEKILNEILSMDLDDNVSFQMKNISSIHDTGNYDDFRVAIEARFFTIKVNLKMDITIGDLIIPEEIQYAFKLMFEERDISIKAYNLNTILAEKIESILVRNVSNTRARDYYDVYILYSLKKEGMDIRSLQSAIRKKAEDRGTSLYIENHGKYLLDIEKSRDLVAIWEAYARKYPYAQGIEFSEITNTLREIFEIIIV